MFVAAISVCPDFVSLTVALLTKFVPARFVIFTLALLSPTLGVIAVGAGGGRSISTAYKLDQEADSPPCASIAFDLTQYTPADEHECEALAELPEFTSDVSDIDVPSPQSNRYFT
jgi:hypothetical protein